VIRPFVLPCALTLAIVMSVAPTGAQLMLPGAVGGSPSEDGGAPQRHGGGGGSAPPAAPAKPVPVKAPNEASVLGHPLLHNGTAGTLVLERSGANLAVRQFNLPGDSVAKPGESCRVDVAGADGRVATPLGRPRGRPLYALDVPDCALSLDVLDGAVLVAVRGGACELARTTCRADLAGLWGPAGASFTPNAAKEMERARLAAETTMRANFHVLLRRAGKDTAAVKAAAAEQAGFSSMREMLCRDYAREATTGFCALTITEGRSLELAAALDGVTAADAGGAVAKPKRHRPKPAPTAPAPTAPALDAQ
jgi:hypothetical protein